jgi:hypothetical protein
LASTKTLPVGSVALRVTGTRTSIATTLKLRPGEPAGQMPSSRFAHGSGPSPAFG